MDPAVDRGAKLIARNRELLTKALEARSWTREAILRGQRVVRDVIRARLVREQSHQQPVAVPIAWERRDLP
jgi:hypothetical protein